MTRVLPGLLLISLACGGLFDADEVVAPLADEPGPDAVQAEPPADDPPPPAPGLAPPSPPWVLEQAGDDEGTTCHWQLRGIEGDPVDLGTLPGGCPGRRFGLDDAGVPSVAATMDGKLVRRSGTEWEALPPPPAGDLSRAVLDGDEIVVATLLMGSFDAPLTYGDRTYSTQDYEGLPAFAIRWRRSADGTWTEEQVVETTTGWDYAQEVDALEPAPGLASGEGQPLTSAGELVDVGAMALIQAPDGVEGWIVAPTAHGRVMSGYFEGEGVRACAPIFVQQEGEAWKEVVPAAEGLSSLDLRLGETHLSVSAPWDGGGRLIDLATGEVVLSTEAQMIWLGAP